MSEPIQCLWIGERLSTMERLSIRSFLHHGHTYHLYVYDKVAGIPPGVLVKDAAAILPRSRIFQYSGFASYAGFANFFRYKLLLENGGWWADADMICLRPLDFPQPYAFATEQARGREVANTGLIKAPANSNALAYCWNRCAQKDPQKLIWGETGPALLAEAVDRFSLQRFLHPHDRFCPLPYPRWRQALAPRRQWDFERSAHTLHLWNEMWRRDKRDKDADYHPQCLYARLQCKYLNG